MSSKPSNPVSEFLRAGLSVFYQCFPPQGFFLERFKRCLHGCSRSGRNPGVLFALFIHDIAPALTSVLVLVVVVVVPGSLIKISLVLESLLLPAFVAAQFITQDLGEKNLAADLTLTEVQPPFRELVHVVDQQRIKRVIGGYTFAHFFPGRIPQVKPQRLIRYPVCPTFFGAGQSEWLCRCFYQNPAGCSCEKQWSGQTLFAGTAHWWRSVFWAALLSNIHSRCGTQYTSALDRWFRIVKVQLLVHACPIWQFTLLWAGGSAAYNYKPRFPVASTTDSLLTGQAASPHRNIHKTMCGWW